MEAFPECARAYIELNYSSLLIMFSSHIFALKMNYSVFTVNEQKLQKSIGTASWDSGIYKILI